MDPWNTPEEIVRQSELIRLLLYLFAYKPGDFSNKLNWEQVNSRQDRGFGL